MTQAIRFNLGWSKEGAEALNRENQSAIARLGYDPTVEQRQPSREEMAKAAQAMFALIKLKTPKS